ncbi:nicotinic acid mononucleotide adenylyltransferase [Pontibacillus halophilus JSM 076056 = DSM 19796]|uniref:Probable nicotinate-nucleotide adenylyltransferase n=1 Tax=Pontibacillus halophilus JSM 076056 = DSM 19796 TaxID=1385510 RepID=A0A0A5GQY8_9BACI|nr:nicotinate-nucleotide adenylyltransferase [Pontibacillus halophilus]KGX93555.1 nicotinic acid mononucleotide adenylyltransferase [Pontibacillus halophilus JSM 076056 = DSM 19796]
MKKIGLLGGTFDPPHLGHLLIAEEVYRSLQLDEVWFIPSHDPPHKDATDTPARDRANMTALATEDNEHFSVNTIEIERTGVSYTVDTIRTLREQYEDASFYFIIGGDIVENLNKWYQIDELLTLVTFVGVKRPGYTLNSSIPVTEVEVPVFEVSSTLIRERIEAGESTRYLLPDSVKDYVKERGLYGKK